jgi:immunity protein 70 of polymorphic toxin system
MGLILCVYEDAEAGDDIDGFQVGSYSDFGAWRDFIAADLEGGQWGSRFPTLMMHSDCDGEWSPDECITLKRELTIIRDEMARLPVMPFHSIWQQKLAAELGLKRQSALDCFINVDGELLVEAIGRLAELAVSRGKPITFT